MSKNPTIVRVGSYPTARRPGMGLAVYELADLPGFCTTIFAYRPERGDKYRPIKDPNVRLVPLPFANPIMPQKRAGPVFLIKQLQRLTAIIRFNFGAIFRLLGKTPEIVHIHSPMHAPTAWWGKMRGAVTCLTIHGSDFVRIAESNWLRRSLQSIDIIFCMTHAHQQQFCQWFPEKRVVYIANGTDVEYFSVGRSDAVARCRQVVGVGTLRWQKNFDALIHAFAKLANTSFDWQLVIFGEGPDRARLIELADRLGISERVSLPGIASREELRDTLQKASIFVLSSVTEGIPKALLEAMASGCACISTDVGDCREVLGEAGIVVPPDDGDRLAEELITLAEDALARQHLSQAATLRSQNYTWNAYREKHSQIYREALERRREIA